MSEMSISQKLRHSEVIAIGQYQRALRYVKDSKLRKIILHNLKEEVEHRDALNKWISDNWIEG